MKILFLSHKFYPDIGGIESLSEMLATAFSEAGHEVRLATWSPDATSKKFCFQVVRCPNLLQLIHEHKWADFVYENNPCLRLSWLGLFWKKPSVISLQTWLFDDKDKIRWQNRAKIKWLRRAQKVIACSDAIRKRCYPPAIVIGNAFNEKLFRVIPDTERKKRFIFLGRLVSDKGADVAIRAFHNLLTSKKQSNLSLSGISLTIVGKGPEQNHLKALVGDLGLNEDIIFAGPLTGSALVTCLNQHQFILVPSMWEEPFGIVALEGMACGCIPIVSNTGGLPEAVGQAGITFSGGDANALTHAMHKLLNNHNLNIQLRKHAPNHLVHFHTNTVANSILNIIEETYSDYRRN